MFMEFNDSADRERNNYQHLSELIKLRFISTTWSHGPTTTNKITPSK